MPYPYTLKEVKQFLGLVGYYRKFIPRYADIARPLNALTRKDTEFVWTDICQKSFDLLKAMVSKEPILVSWPENQGILFFLFYISQTLQMNRISFMAFLLNAVL